MNDGLLALFLSARVRGHRINKNGIIDKAQDPPTSTHWRQDMVPWNKTGIILARLGTLVKKFPAMDFGFLFAH